MIALADALHDHPRAVERDLLALGYHMSDVGGRLSLSELVSVVVAAPSGSALRDALDEGWTRNDHLLANLTEQSAGLMRLDQRYPRPGIITTPPPDLGPVDDLGQPRWEAMTVDELEAKRRQHRMIDDG